MDEAAQNDLLQQLQVGKKMTRHNEEAVDMLRRLSPGQTAHVTLHGGWAPADVKFQPLCMFLAQCLAAAPADHAIHVVLATDSWRILLGALSVLQNYLFLPASSGVVFDVYRNGGATIIDNPVHRTELIICSTLTSEAEALLRVVGRVEILIVENRSTIPTPVQPLVTPDFTKVVLCTYTD